MLDQKYGNTPRFRSMMIGYLMLFPLTYGEETILVFCKTEGEKSSEKERLKLFRETVKRLQVYYFLTLLHLRRLVITHSNFSCRKL